MKKVMLLSILLCLVLTLSLFAHTHCHSASCDCICKVIQSGGVSACVRIALIVFFIGALCGATIALRQVFTLFSQKIRLNN